MTNSSLSGSYSLSQNITSDVCTLTFNGGSQNLSPLLVLMLTFNNKNILSDVNGNVVSYSPTSFVTPGTSISSNTFSDNVLSINIVITYQP